MSKNCLLSLAIIMRDAAEEIGACLESVAGAVDEMVVVDTGSLDDSVKTVRKFLRKWQGAAPGRRGKLYNLVWQDDFSRAKNYALSRCHGEYVLFLDSDESLSEGTRGNLRPLAAALSRGDWPRGIRRVQIPGEKTAEEAGGFDLLEIWRENVDLAHCPLPGQQDDLAVRLLRRQQGLRYVGEVHEQLVFADGHLTRVAAADKKLLKILHTGYRPEVDAAKKQRNYEILLKEERQGGSTFLLDYYLAEAHLDRQEWREALACALRSFATGRPVHEPAAPYRLAYQALRELERSACQKAGLQIDEGEPLPEEQPGEPAALQEARRLRRQGEEMLARGMAEFPDHPEFYYFRGGRRWNGGDKEGGRADLEHALELARAFPKVHPEADFRFRELLPSLLSALEQVHREMEGED